MRFAPLALLMALACSKTIVLPERDGGPTAADGGAIARDAGAAELAWRSYDVSVTDTLRAIHGTSARDVWAVGARGVVLHFDGTRWTREDPGLLDGLHAVHAISSDEVWAVGENGAITRRRAGGWAPVTGVVPIGIGGDLPRLVGVAATGPGDVWITPDEPVDVGGVTSEHAALRYDGRGWTTVERPNPGSAERGIALAGSSGFILHDGDLQERAGDAWSNVAPPVRESLLGFTDLSLDPAGRPWVIGYQITPSRTRVFRREAGRWSELEGPGLEEDLFSTDLTAIFALDGEAWAVGDLGVLSHFDGARWDFAIRANFAAPRLLDVFVSEGKVFAVGAHGAVYCAGCP